MTYFNNFLLILIFLFAIVSCQTESNSPPPTEAQEIESNAITVTDGWARPATAGGNSAVYMSIMNGTEQTDTLRNIETEQAGKAEIHETYEQDEMMGMRPAGMQPIPADSSLELRPGGLHVMLMGIRDGLAEGDTLSLTLFFSREDRVRIQVPVQLSN